MKKTFCYSVRLVSLTDISDKSYKATAFDGSSCILPKSCVKAMDYEVQKSAAYWIAAWILKQKDLQYSCKKQGWYNPATGIVEPPFNTIIEKHIPAKVDAVQFQPNKELIRK